VLKKRKNFVDFVREVYNKNMKKYLSLFVSVCAIFPLISHAQNTASIENVSQFSAESGDRKIILTWQKPSQQILGYKIFFGTKSVQNKESEKYDQNVLLPNPEIQSYTLSGLFNNIDYFLSIKTIGMSGDLLSEYAPEIKIMPVVSGDAEPPILKTGIQESENSMKLTFSKLIQIKDAQYAFQVKEKYGNTSINVITSEAKGNEAFITVESGKLLPENTYVVMATSLVEDLQGRPVTSGKSDTIEFVAQSFENTETQADTQASTTTEATSALTSFSSPTETTNTAFNKPNKLEVKNVKVDTKKIKDEKMVYISWTPNDDPSITDQILFTKKKGEDWDKGFSLGLSISSMGVNVELNQQYEVKIVTMNNLGIQSKGKPVKFSTYLLPKSGPLDIAAVIGILGLLFVGTWIFRGKES